MSVSKTPKKVGPYQMGEMIGKGSIGLVYKGLNIETGQIVAIKQVSLQNIKTDVFKSIQQEINLLKKLKHDNIVTYIDFIHANNFYNIILEYVESGSLANIIKKFGPFNESLVAIYIKQVLTGLVYLHSQGIVHRDIKGANILTTKNGIVKLTDFGVATKLSDDDNSQSFVGTPYWMAPETIEMHGHLSTACDIWSVGCTIIELVTGNPPYYDHCQYSALFRMVDDMHPPLPEGISVNCRDFLLQCFEKEPSQRIDAQSLLKHPWIKNQNQSKEMQEFINSPNQELPEEVTNTIRLHIDKQQNVGNLIKQDDQFQYQQLQNVPNQSSQTVQDINDQKQKFKQNTNQQYFQFDQNKQEIVQAQQINKIQQHFQQQQQLQYQQQERIINNQNNFQQNHWGYQQYDSGQGNQVNHSNNNNLLINSIQNFDQHLQSIDRNLQQNDQFNSLAPFQLRESINNAFLQNISNCPLKYVSNGIGSGSIIGTIDKNFGTLTNLQEGSGEKINQQQNFIEGSFVSVLDQNQASDPVVPYDQILQFKFRKRPQIMQTQQQQQCQDQDKQLSSNINNYNSLYNNNQTNKQDYKLIQEINEIMANFTQSNQLIFNDEQILLYQLHVEHLTKILQQYPKCKYYIMKQYGLTYFLDIIDQSLLNEEKHKLIVIILSLINLIVEQDGNLLEMACLFGVIPYMIKFSGCNFDRNIRLEAGYFFTQMSYTSSSTMYTLLVGGACEALVEFLDGDYVSNKDLSCLGIETLLMIYELNIMSPANLCKILLKFNFFLRLVNILDNFWQDEDQAVKQFLLKGLNLMIIFSSCEDKKIKYSLCESEVIQMLLLFLDQFQSNSQALFKVIRVFRYIASEVTVNNKLENIGLIPKALELLKIILDMYQKQLILMQQQLTQQQNIQSLVQSFEEGLQHLLKIIMYMTNMNNVRQELIALHDGIPLIIQVCTEKNRNLRKFSIPIICQLVQASSITREKLWEAGGPSILLAFLEDDNFIAKILSTISIWMELDMQRVESILLENQVLGKLIECLKQSNKIIFSQIISTYTKLVFNSEKLAQKLGKSTEFLQELVERLGIDPYQEEQKKKKILRPECSMPSSVVSKEILEILLQLCLKHHNPRTLIDNHHLQPIIVQILQRAHTEDMVILEEISTQLLKVYQENSGSNAFSRTHKKSGNMSSELIGHQQHIQ